MGRTEICLLPPTSSKNWPSKKTNGMDEIRIRLLNDENAPENKKITVPGNKTTTKSKPPLKPTSSSFSTRIMPVELDYERRDDVESVDSVTNENEKSVHDVIHGEEEEEDEEKQMSVSKLRGWLKEFEQNQKAHSAKINPIQKKSNSTPSSPTLVTPTNNHDVVISQRDSSSFNFTKLPFSERQTTAPSSVPHIHTSSSSSVVRSTARSVESRMDKHDGLYRRTMSRSASPAPRFGLEKNNNNNSTRRIPARGGGGITPRHHHHARVLTRCPSPAILQSNRNTFQPSASPTAAATAVPKPNNNKYRFKPRITKEEVQATDNGYAPVEKLAKWLSDDPFEKKKKVSTIRKGAKVIAKSKMFEREEQQPAADLGLLLPVPRKVMPVLVLPKKVDDKKEDMEESNEPVNVADRKEWLKNVFSQGVEK